MAKKFDFLSPGIEIREIDKSFLPFERDAEGPIIIGRTRKGPAMKPVKIKNLDDFIAVFGTPCPGGTGEQGDTWREGNTTGPTYASYAAQAWLASEESPVTIVRIAGEQHPSAASAAGYAGWAVGARATRSISTTIGSNATAYGLFLVNSGATNCTSTGTGSQSLHLLEFVLSNASLNKLSKNIKDLDRPVNYNSIFSIDRFGQNDLVEGGGSLTIGLEYSNRNKNNREIVNISLANVLRPSKNEDLPLNNSMGEKRSDIVGKLNFIPSDSFNLDYEFSLDNNLNDSNLNLIRTNFSVNNFITSFEFLEEDNLMGSKSYVSNKTTLNLDNNNSISFKTNKDLDKNITEYYNLIYEYKNDCLIAGVEYNKSNYADGDLKPEENLFFKIKIIPFGELNTPSVKQ